MISAMVVFLISPCHSIKAVSASSILRQNLIGTRAMSVFNGQKHFTFLSVHVHVDKLYTTVLFAFSKR